MDRKILFLTCALAATFALSVPAKAQQTKPIGLSVRAGGFFPSNGDARDESDIWFAGGLEYKIKDLEQGQFNPDYRGTISVSLDYYGSGDFSSVPLLLNYTGRTNEFYYTVGAGIAFTEKPDGSDTEERTRLAYQLGVGYDFQQGRTPLFIEGKFFGNSTSKLTGFAILVGARL